MNEAPKVPGNNSLPQGTSTGGITPPTGGTPGVPTQGGANPKLQATAQATAVLDKVTGADQSMPSVGEKVVDLDNPQIDENGDVVEPQLKPGDKIAPGKEVDENGEVKETALNKTLKSVFIGISLYFIMQLLILGIIYIIGFFNSDISLLFKEYTTTIMDSSFKSLRVSNFIFSSKISSNKVL